MFNNSDLSAILACKLFNNISENEFYSMEACISPNYRHYKKGEYICREGESMRYLGIILEGEVILERIDYWGNRTLQAKLHKSEVFGEAYACMPQASLIMDIVAVTDVRILFVDVHKIMDICQNMCSHHKLLSRNLLDILVHKNLFLNAKAVHLSQRSTRNKIMSYLSEQSTFYKSNDFIINLDRQGLADYLCVDRSALSSELSKLKNQGMIDFKKNHFKLLYTEEAL